MAESVFEEMKRYVAFEEPDIINVRELAGYARPLISRVVERFYEQLLQHPSASAVFTGGEAQMTRQKALLSNWLSELFVGPYDVEYYQKRLRIGITHVRVGLPQRYMILGMELVRRELQRLLLTASPDPHRKLDSLHKLLTLELSIMMESYQAGYSESIRQTERNAVEERLTRSEHLAEIGQLAASLAHDIKNPLAGISGAIQILRSEMAATDPHRPILGEILGLISRLDATVKDLLLYARPTPPKPKTFNLHDVVTRVLFLLREEPAFQEVKIDYVPDPTAILPHADEAQVEHLLINLLINAAQASKKGGAVELTLRREGPWVCVTVADRGAGMSADVQARAFEPFFTTKSKGTGLGLSICRRIVELHGGAIQLHSLAGQGTTVTVRLPDPTNPAGDRA